MGSLSLLLWLSSRRCSIIGTTLALCDGWDCLLEELRGQDAYRRAGSSNMHSGIVRVGKGMMEADAAGAHESWQDAY